MDIRSLTLWTNELEKQRVFYRDVLGFSILEDSLTEFTVQAGSSYLTFKESIAPHIYHYCFLIPSNKVYAAVAWLESRLDVLTIEGDKVVEPTTMWNADSIYFYDGAGNIAEFIARYDLDNDTPGEFSNRDILNLNEIGAPSTNISILNSFLEQTLGSKFYTGNLTRFGTHGDENGMFLLVNNTVKDKWFPTDLFPESAPFQVTVEVNGKITCLNFEKGGFRT